MQKAINLAPQVEVTSDQIRLFVKNLAELTEKINELKAELKKVVKENDDLQNIDQEMKDLRARKKEIMMTNAILVSHANEVADAVDERKQLIDDAKQDGIPKAEIDVAIKMLKKNIDPTVTTEVFKNIADLVD